LFLQDQQGEEDKNICELKNNKKKPAFICFLSLSILLIHEFHHNPSLIVPVHFSPNKTSVLEADPELSHLGAGEPYREW
jgi:hypothetical protein